jgi:hypothetical protein
MSNVIGNGFGIGLPAAGPAADNQAAPAFEFLPPFFMNRAFNIAPKAITDQQVRHAISNFVDLARIALQPGEMADMFSKAPVGQNRFFVHYHPINGPESRFLVAPYGQPIAQDNSLTFAYNPVGNVVTPFFNGAAIQPGSPAWPKLGSFGFHGVEGVINQPFPGFGNIVQRPLAP